MVKLQNDDELLFLKRLRDTRWFLYEISGKQNTSCFPPRRTAKHKIFPLPFANNRHGKLENRYPCLVQKWSFSSDFPVFHFDGTTSTTSHFGKWHQYPARGNCWPENFAGGLPNRFFAAPAGDIWLCSRLQETHLALCEIRAVGISKSICRPFL